MSKPSSHSPLMELIKRQEMLDREFGALEITTVAMFLDIADWSGLCDREGNATALISRTKVFNRAENLITGSGGKIREWRGDGLISTFEEPIIATQAAVDIMRDLRAAAITSPAGQKLQVKICLHMGTVISDEEIIAGKLLNETSRIEEFAESGDIIVSGTIRAAITSQPQFTVVPKKSEVYLKGISGSVDLWAIDWFKTISGPFSHAQCVTIRRDALATEDRNRCKKLLESIVEYCSGHIQDADPFPAIFKANALTELARITQHPNFRAKYWSTALDVLRNQYQLKHNLLLLDSFVDVAIDAYQDSLSASNKSERLDLLRECESKLTVGIGKAENQPLLASALLSRKSAVLRYLADHEVAKVRRKQFIEESQRCSSLAISLAKIRSAYLEQAMVLWWLARLSDSDLEAVSRLRQSEQILLEITRDQWLPAALALCRLYRSTNRPGKVCDIWPQSAANARQVLRSGEILAEAVTIAVRNDYPPAFVQQYAATALELLERALHAGYAEARNAVALAMLRALTEDNASGEAILNDLLLKDTSGLDWTSIHRIVANNYDNRDFINTSLRLGCDQSSTLNGLGTYAADILHNSDLAEAFYRCAIKMNHRNAVALANLARLMLRTVGAKAETLRLINQAASYSFMDFKWWIPLMVEYNLQNKTQKHRKSGMPADNMKDILYESCWFELKETPLVLHAIWELANLCPDVIDTTTPTDSSFDYMCRDRGGRIELATAWTPASTVFGRVLMCAANVGEPSPKLSLGAHSTYEIRADEIQALLKGNLSFSIFIDRSQRRVSQKKQIRTTDLF